MKYLSLEELHEINETVIWVSGGTQGSVNEANLFHVFSRAKPIKTISRIAAFYLYSLGYQAHAFTDGNKRTAIAAMLLFLQKNGCSIETNNEELIGIALSVASGSTTLKEAEKWVKTRIKSKKRQNTNK